MTASAQRIADLERQVADLAARIEQVARKAATLRSLEEVYLDERAARAPASRSTAPRPPIRRPRHLQIVGGAR
jgi:hypothetical protein